MTKTRHEHTQLTRLLRCSLAATAFSFSLPGHALNIVITNDDGCEASPSHALYQRLTAAGHQVLISAPVLDQTGVGGSLPFLRPVTPISTPSRAGNLPAGTPGISTLERVNTLDYGSRVFCVNSTPVGAALHGIDVAAEKVFGTLPDLVISGPDFDKNTGMVNNLSGAVNAALIAINRGIPGISVGLGQPGGYRSLNVLQAADREYEQADLVVTLVDKLEHQARIRGDELIPVGYGLNVNFPAYTPGEGDQLKWIMSDVGTGAGGVPFFVSNIGETLVAKRVGLGGVNLPGIAIETRGLNDPAKEGLAFIDDHDPLTEENVLESGAIAVTVIRGNHQADLQTKNLMWERLNGLVEAQEPSLPGRFPAISETTLESRW